MLSGSILRVFNPYNSFLWQTELNLSYTNTQSWFDSHDHDFFHYTVKSSFKYTLLCFYTTKKVMQLFLNTKEWKRWKDFYIWVNYSFNNPFQSKQHSEIESKMPIVRILLNKSGHSKQAQTVHRHKTLPEEATKKQMPLSVRERFWDFLTSPRIIFAENCSF